MIIDSSALVAILKQEPEAKRFATAIMDDPVRLISAANWLEASMLAFSNRKDEGLRDMDLLIARYGIETVAVTPRQAEFARRAFITFGKGTHAARLNFGDCLAYGLSQDTGEPLLFKGEDFSRTDVQAAAY
jgi:ribonuclease VapC